MLAIQYPFFRQKNMRDCGIATLRMIAAYHGREVEVDRLRQLTRIDRVGTSLATLKRAGREYGLQGEGVLLQNLEQLELIAPDRPAVLLLDGNHFVVYYGKQGREYVIGDPARGIRRVRSGEMGTRLLRCPPGIDTDPVGYALLFEPTDIPEQTDQLPSSSIRAEEDDWRKQVAFLARYLGNVKVFFPVVLLGIAAITLVQYLLPYFTKLVVDIGIGSGNLAFVGYLLAGQLALILGKTAFNVLRGWLVLHLSLRINYQLIHSFLRKLFRLPIPFYATRRIGDILQRISDHRRIESFLTQHTLSVVISILTVVVYSLVLFYFHPTFFYLFAGASVLYLGWITFFLKRRKHIDLERFRYATNDQTLTLQILNGMQDLKINGGQEYFLDKWKNNKVDSFKNTADYLRVNQIQDTGTMLIIELTQLSILFLSASLIIDNQITLGTLLSIQFIIGQLISPMEQIVQAVIRGQEASISLGRISEFWQQRDESSYFGKPAPARAGKEANQDLAVAGDIRIRDLVFHHPGQQGDPALNGIDLVIPAGKVTAIVGGSGSGKTTLLKLLLGYFLHYEGSLQVGDREFRELPLEDWRDRCGVILQESFVFNDTIRGNILLGGEYDEERFQRAVEITNLQEFVGRMPQQYDTPIGQDGKGLSMGQKQRILMARAIYKDPAYVLMDEATNSLDAENETMIMGALRRFFVRRTVIVVAHRLSTINFADNIVVLHRGQIAEQGTHDELLALRGRYYHLIQQQLSA